ncbi:MAG: LysM peptidoglycan-binding domain-containing protein [Hymenobacter sp.]|nr:MAG: LysM peptidoglycan-binding domain-containing protein [Hymenobacter sp.]
MAQLNQWLLARAVPQDGRSYTLLVPLAGTPPLATAPALAIPAAALPAPNYLRINGIRALLARPGETPAALAARGGASLGFFLKVNELADDEPLTPNEPYFFQRKKEAADEDYHVMARGQTLAAVAQHYGVLRRALRLYNHLPNDEAVQPGLVLWLSHIRPRNVAAEYQTVPGSRPVAARPPLVVVAAPQPAPVQQAAAPDDSEELASINDLPTEVPGPPVQPLPAPRPAVAMETATSPARPAVATPIRVRPVVVLATTASARPAADFSHPYLVAPGETLYALARRVGVRPTELAAWNNISPIAPLRAGQALHLSPPATEPSLMAEVSSNGVYTVATGDTFFSISRRYNCTVAALLAHNERPTPTLRVGETLRVPRQ